MKSDFKHIILILIFALSGIAKLYAQDPESAVKSALNNLFSFSKSKAYDKAALLITYDGDDKNRSQKDSYNPANKDELSQARRKCKEISALIDLSSKYEIGKFTTSDFDGREIYTIDVNFISGEQKLVKSYTFIKAVKGYLLIKVN